MAKLKTVNKWRAGHTTILAVVGEVTFDENAEFEVDDDKVDLLISILPEFSLVGGDEEEDIKKKSEDGDGLEKGDEGEDIEPQVADLAANVSEVDIRKKLSALPVKILKEDYLSNYPEEIVKELKNKNEYVDFLVDQLS